MIKREVALKTIRDTPNRAALQLFYKECDVLAAMSHPNIVEIFDIGEFTRGGRGQTLLCHAPAARRNLDELIRDSSHRLTVERVVEICARPAGAFRPLTSAAWCIATSSPATCS